jgi:sugar O-acyltransferase (sialic acid O-acetyltransferase NeuD family)
MKNLIIIGAGGMGRTYFDMARESLGFRANFSIKGYIDDNLQALDNFQNYPPLIDKISNYMPQKNDVFICSIGGTVRRKCIEIILDKGGEFHTLIHKTARIGTNVKLGKGNLIGAYTAIGADASIGNYNFIQSYTVIGHDVKIGNWNRIDSHVLCVGGISIGDEVMIHTSAVLNHNVVVDSNSHIGACSFVTRNVERETTVFGNPARRLM